MKNPQKDWVRGLGLLSWILAEIIGLTVVLGALGYWLQTRFGFPKWVPLLTGGLGFVMAMVRITRVAQSDAAKQDESE